MGLIERLPRTSAVYLPRGTWRLEGQADGDTRGHVFPEEEHAEDYALSLARSARLGVSSQAAGLGMVSHTDLRDLLHARRKAGVSCARARGTAAAKDVPTLHQ